MSTLFTTNIEGIYGNRGTEWLANLPNMVTEIAAQYGLSDLLVVNNLSYNYVLAGMQGEQPIILKLSLDVDGLKLEAAALQAFADHGAAKVLAANEGVLLLQRAVPGISLRAYFPANDLAAIEITHTVMRKLHQAILPKAGFPHIVDWLMVLDKSWPVPNRYLKKARELRDQLLITSNKAVLLHGDLHHDNILINGEHIEVNSNNFLVIDPKGVVGDPCYEVAAFIRNPLPEIFAEAEVKNIISKRINIFSKLTGWHAQRITDWCFVQAVLAWIWALEDGCDVNNFKKLTSFFDTININ